MAIGLGLEGSRTFTDSFTAKHCCLFQVILLNHNQLHALASVWPVSMQQLAVCLCHELIVKRMLLTICYARLRSRSTDNCSHSYDLPPGHHLWPPIIQPAEVKLQDPPHFLPRFVGLSEVICRLSTSLPTSTLWMPKPSPSLATATVKSPRQAGGRLILDVMFEGLERQQRRSGPEVTEVPHLHRFVRAVVLEKSPREMKLAQSSARHEPPSPIGVCQNDRRPDRSNRET